MIADYTHAAALQERRETLSDAVRDLFVAEKRGYFDLPDTAFIDAVRAAYERDRADSVELGRVRELLAEAYKAMSGKPYHASDCATSCAPAETPGPCNCATPAGPDWRDIAESLYHEAHHGFGCTCTFESDECCGFARARTALAQVQA